MSKTNPAAAGLPDPLMDLKEVLELTGLCRATIYNMRATGRFPQPLQISPRRVAWRMSDVLGYIASRERAVTGKAAANL